VPLLYQIVGPQALLLLAAVVGASAVEAWWAARFARERIEHQLQRLASTVESSNFPLTAGVLAQMQGLSSAEFVVTDPQGRVTLATAAVSSPVALPPPASSSRELRLGEAIEAGGVRYLHAAVPSPGRSARDAPYVLHVLFPEELWRQSLRTAVAPPFAVGLGALALGVPCGVLLSRRFCRRIESLRGHLGRLADGDYTPASLSKVDDELRDLAGSANALAAQLAGLESAIRVHEQREALGQLGGGLAHELRNGIAGARMAIKIHERHCDASDSESLQVALQQLDLVREQLQRYLLTQSPVSRGDDRCELVSVLEEIARLLGPAFVHRRVELTMPGEQAADLAIPLGHEQARSLLSNLLLNALEAAGAEGWVRVEVVSLPHAELAVRVVDSGTGVAAAIAPRMFEPFVTTKHEGAGLGLALCRQLAASCGGALHYFRQAGATCFEFRAPRADSTAAGAPARWTAPREALA
jgi:signal transduction histidine kinase